MSTGEHRGMARFYWFHRTYGWRGVFRAYVWDPVTGPIGYCAFLFALGFGVMWWASNSIERSEREFMDACLEERKEYECIAMWRSGNVTVIPVVIPSVGG